MRWLICTSVVRICHKQALSWRSPCTCIKAVYLWRDLRHILATMTSLECIFSFLGQNLAFLYMFIIFRIIDVQMIVFNNKQMLSAWYEPPHDKTKKMACAPSEDADQAGHPPSLIRVFAVCQWVAKELRFLHADSEDSDQTGRMPRLIWAGRTLILFVLSCRGSYLFVITRIMTSLECIIWATSRENPPSGFATR